MEDSAHELMQHDQRQCTYARAFKPLASHPIASPEPLAPVALSLFLFICSATVSSASLSLFFHLRLFSYTHTLLQPSTEPRRIRASLFVTRACLSRSC